MIIRKDTPIPGDEIASTESPAAVPPVEAVSGPQVSALITSRNCINDLRRLLASLEASQERNRLEIIVVDNSSRDGSGRVDQEFEGVHVLRLQKNFGRTRALNIGTRTAKGDYLLLLEPHMEVQPETVVSLVRAFEETPGAGAVCPLTLGDKGEPELRIHQLPDSPTLAAIWRGEQEFPALPAQFATEPVPAEFISRAAVLVRRDFVKGMNFFDERYGDFGPELELCFQIRQAGKKLFVLPQTTIRRHALPGWWEAAPSPIKAQQSADFALGAARYIGKREGSMAGIKFQFSAALAALGRTLTFQAPGYNARRLLYLVTGQKVDGTQGD